MSGHAAITPYVIARIYRALPRPPGEPIDYYEIKARVPDSHRTIRVALKTMKQQGRVEGARAGLRGRVVFRRAR